MQQRTILKALAVAVALTPAVAFTQSAKPTSATYITAEEVATVHALPGVDRTVKVVEIGGEHFSIGTIHRGATAPAGGAGRAAGAAAGGAAAAGGGGRAGGAAAGGGAGRGGGAAAGGAAGGGAGRAAAVPCGTIAAAPASGGAAGMIAHDSQTEGYLITSGGGTLMTGGKIYNGSQSAADAEVTTTLNGPSCSGTAYGDVTRKVVKTGDIIIIPAGVPHGWTDIADHVDYLSFRPSGQTLTAGYVNPAIKK
jgi:hypothetical protein